MGYIETDLGNISFNPREEYSNAAVYEYLDLISYGGSSYVCRIEYGKTIKGVAPVVGASSDEWLEIARAGSLTDEYKGIYENVKEWNEIVKANLDAVIQNADKSNADKAVVERLRAEIEEIDAQHKKDKEATAGYAKDAKASKEAAVKAADKIEGLVGGFDSKVETAEQSVLSEIEADRSKAVQAVADAKDAAARAIDTKTSESVDAITDAGTKAVKSVSDNVAAAKSSADKAAASETAAKSSETAAASSASSAKTSEINAASSAAAAEKTAKSIHADYTDLSDKVVKLSEEIESYGFSVVDGMLCVTYKEA